MSESTWTRELYYPRLESCSKIDPATSVMELPSDEIVNVVMKPSLSSPEYAKAYVSESICNRELYFPRLVSCSNVSTFVIVEPSAGMVNVVIQPSSSPPAYAKAYVSESTCTSELYYPLIGACSKVASYVIVLPSDEIENVEM